MIHIYMIVCNIFFNALYFSNAKNANKNISHQIGKSAFSMITGYLVFVVSEIIMINICNVTMLTMNKNTISFDNVNSLTQWIKFRSTIIFGIMLCSFGFYWYFIYIFGIVMNKEQATIVLMTVFSIVEFIFLQMIFGLIATLFWYLGITKR